MRWRTASHGVQGPGWSRSAERTTLFHDPSFVERTSGLRLPIQSQRDPPQRPPATKRGTPSNRDRPKTTMRRIRAPSRDGTRAVRRLAARRSASRLSDRPDRECVQRPPRGANRGRREADMFPLMRRQRRYTGALPPKSAGSGSSCRAPPGRQSPGTPDSCVRHLQAAHPKSPADRRLPAGPRDCGARASGGTSRAVRAPFAPQTPAKKTPAHTRRPGPLSRCTRCPAVGRQSAPCTATRRCSRRSTDHCRTTARPCMGVRARRAPMRARWSRASPSPSGCVPVAQAVQLSPLAARTRLTLLESRSPVDAVAPRTGTRISAPRAMQPASTQLHGARGTTWCSRSHTSRPRSPAHVGAPGTSGCARAGDARDAIPPSPAGCCARRTRSQGEYPRAADARQPAGLAHERSRSFPPRQSPSP